MSNYTTGNPFSEAEDIEAWGQRGELHSAQFRGDEADLLAAV